MENTMTEIKIVKLTPEYLDDYLYFFENVAHTDHKEWDRCYCVEYAGDANAGVDFSDAEKRREMAVRYIKEGVLQGYLAYHEGRLVGWCNANRRADCTGCDGWRQTFGDYNPAAVGNVKSVFCFTVAPEMRCRGIAEMLLRRVLSDADTEGYDAVEGYPEKRDCDCYDAYVGPLHLYEKLGFARAEETETRYIMRKNLK